MPEAAPSVPGASPYGANASAAQPQYQAGPTPTAGSTQAIYDHTSEFDPKDISENKVYCMLCYLFGILGIIIALLAGRDSAFIKFHVRQAMKILVTEVLAAICYVLLMFIIILISGLGSIGHSINYLATNTMGISSGFLLLLLFVLVIFFIVITIVAFFQICRGKAKEPVIIRNLGFLK